MPSFFFIIIAHYCVSFNTAEIKKGNLCLQFQTTSNETLNQKALLLLFLAVRSGGKVGMEGHTGKLCSRYIHRLLDPSLGPFSSAVFPVDLTSLLLIQYLPEGKSPSLKFLEGSTLGVTVS